MQRRWDDQRTHPSANPFLNEAIMKSGHPARRVAASLAWRRRVGRWNVVGRGKRCSGGAQARRGRVHASPGGQKDARNFPPPRRAHSVIGTRPAFIFRAVGHRGRPLPASNVRPKRVWYVLLPPLSSPIFILSAVSDRVNRFVAMRPR